MAGTVWVGVVIATGTGAYRIAVSWSLGSSASSSSELVSLVASGVGALMSYVCMKLRRSPAMGHFLVGAYPRALHSLLTAQMGKAWSLMTLLLLSVNKRIG